MEIKWSQAQLDAIESRGCNLLVSAAAGSGKTAVLAQRLVRALADKNDPLDIDRVLVVTFTRAAASQMRERIGKGLDRLIEKEPDNRYLRHQKLMLSAAHISTIHSLCSDLIQEHFDLLDLDPSYRMGDENELNLLKADVVKDVLEVYYSSGNAAFSSFMSAYSSGRSDRNVSEWILKGYEMSRSCPSPEYWLDSCLRWYHVPDGGMNEHLMVKNAMKMARRSIEECINILEEAESICALSDGPAAYMPMISSAKEDLSVLLGTDDYERLSQALTGISFKALSSKKQPDASEENKEAVKDAFKNVRNKIKALPKSLLAGSLEDLAGELEFTEPYARMLTELIRAFSERYQEEKRDRNILDFSDLEHYALKLLAEFYTDDNGELRWRPTAAADELSGQFQEIICDEYQDSNRVQEMILEALSGSRLGKYNRFMVGDVKQSIYGFRLADAGIFLDKYDSYQHLDHCRKIDLNENFRSREYILKCVNSIFRRVMRPEAGGIDYNENASLKAGAHFPEGGTNIPSCVDLIIVDRSGSENGETADAGASELEAAAIADEIIRITDQKTGIDIRSDDGGHYRKAVYSDIVILLRSVKSYADAMVNVLNARGIPATAQLSVGFFSAPEIMTMTSLLDIIDNPRQDIPLAAVLHSPIAGMTNDEMAMIRSYTSDTDLYGAVTGCPEDKPEYEKVQRFLKMLESLRDASEYMQVDELIEYAFSITGYYDYASAMPAGSRRKANLDMLLERASDFMATGMSGLFNFMRYIQQIRDNQIDFGEAQTGNGEGHVSIVSIHKSKGLEYPVVFLAGLNRRMNRRDLNSAMTVHPVYGIGLNAVNPANHHKMKTMYREFISSVLEEEMVAEELRILYVAMTRAEEKLYLTGCANKAAEELDAWRHIRMDSSGRMKPGDIVKAKRFFDIIMPCLFDNGSASGIEELYDLSGNVHHPDDAADLFRIRVVSAESVAEGDASDAGRMIRLRDMLMNDASDKLYRSAAGDSNVSAELDKDAVWEYIWKDDLNVKGKYSVSELKAGTMPEEDSEYMYQMQSSSEEYVPVFMRDDGTGDHKKHTEINTGSERGTAYHRVMELIEPVSESGDLPDEQEISSQISSMVSSGKLEAGQSEMVNADDILTFLQSSLGRRFAAAYAGSKLHREQQFVMGMPAYMVRDDSKSDELLVVQGVIDAWFEENGSLILLDYKTDHVPPDGGSQILISRYRRQLELYKYALERSTGKRVSETYIYSFRLKEVIRCET